MSEDSRRRNLLDTVKSELASIPKYKSSADGKSSSSAVAATSNAFTAIRRGIRMMKGAESSAALTKKKKRLESILRNEKKLKSMTFELGSKNGPVDYKGNPVKDSGNGVATSQTVSQVLSKMYKDLDKK
jgi:hypothetical protein